MKRLLLIVALLIGFLQATFASSLPSLIPYRARDDKWGFCNPKKEIIIPIQYDDARPYHRKRAAVKGGAVLILVGILSTRMVKKSVSCMMKLKTFRMIVLWHE